VPFRGDYCTLTPEARPLVRTLVYPVPDPSLPFLGVHFTRRVDGQVWAGPNAVLALAREGYRRRALQPGELAETLSFEGFRRLARRNWRMGVEEMWRDVSRSAFLARLRRYLPDLESTDLQWGPSGVRAQAVGPDGALVDDFVITRTARALYVRNAPSPAATASLAIGDHLARELETVLG
jgi:L-2-hydroxyglutarate oxidase LhgO